MARRVRILSVALGVAIAMFGFGQGRAADATWYGDAVQNLRSGWSQQLVYQAPIVFPAHLALHDSGNVLVGDGATDRVVMQDADGKLYPFADLSSMPGGGVSTLTYQRARQRLLVFSKDGGIYASADGSHTLLGSGDLVVGAVTVDTADDSVYLHGVDDSGGHIRHLDSSGTMVSELATASTSVSGIALDEANDKLYFADAFQGTLTAVDLKTNVASVVGTDVGDPGTTEPVNLAMGGDGNLYYYNSGDGLCRYNGPSSFTQVVNGGITGAGPIIWAPHFAAFMQAHLGGANLVAFDPVGGTATQMTAPFNARAVVEADDGTILVSWEADGQYVQRVTGSGYTRFTANLGANCAALERDGAGRIYAGLSDGRILTVGPSGETSAWATIDTAGGAYVLSYDAADDELAAIVPNQPSNATSITRVPLADPVGGATSWEVSGVVGNAACVDEKGDTYLLDVKADKVHRISRGTTQATEFIDGVLADKIITAPAMEYSRAEKALVVSRVRDYQLWPLSAPTRLTLADNTGGVDNLTISETRSGGLVAVHSGRVFRLTFTPQSPPPSNPPLPGHHLTAPYAPSTAYYGRTFTIYGFLKPKHTAGAYSVKVEGYRYERQSDGTHKWVRRATWYTKNHNYSTYTKYVEETSTILPGRWRIRAVHTHTGYLPKYSAWRYMTVR